MNKICISKLYIYLLTTLLFIFFFILFSQDLINKKTSINSRASISKNNIRGIGQPCDTKGLCEKGLECYHKPSFYKNIFDPDAWLETECNVAEEIEGRELYRCKPNFTCNDGLTCRDFRPSSIDTDMTLEDKIYVPKNDPYRVDELYIFNEAPGLLHAIDMGRYLKEKNIPEDKIFKLNRSITNSYNYVAYTENFIKILDEIYPQDKFGRQNIPNSFCIPKSVDPLSSYLDTMSGMEGYFCKAGYKCNDGLYCINNITGCPLNYFGHTEKKFLTEGLFINQPPLFGFDGFGNYNKVEFWQKNTCYSKEKIMKINKDALFDCEYPGYRYPTIISEENIKPSVSCGKTSEVCCADPDSTKTCDDMNTNSCVSNTCLTVKDVLKSNLLRNDLNINALDDYYLSQNDMLPVPIYNINGDIRNYTSDRLDYGYPIITNPDKTSINKVRSSHVIQIRDDKWKNVPLMKILNSKYVSIPAILYFNKHIYNTVKFAGLQNEGVPYIRGVIDCGDGVNTDVEAWGRFIYKDGQKLSSIILTVSGYDKYAKQTNSSTCNWDWDKDYVITLKKLIFAKDYLNNNLSSEDSIEINNLSIKSNIKFTKQVILVNKR